MTILLSRVFVMVLLAAGIDATAQTPARTPSSAPLSESWKKVSDSYREALSVIVANHASGPRLNVEQVTTKSIDSMVHFLDPHSGFLDAKESAEFRASMNSRYFGIGAAINDLRNADLGIVGTFVRVPFRNSPAFLAGLRYGDKIVEVNGVSTLGKSSADTRDLLRGPLGTSVKLVVDRGGQRLPFTIVRAAIPQPSIPDAYLIKPRVGYIAMTEATTADLATELRKALAQVVASGADSLLLDLRGNGGGLVGPACVALQEFVPNGQLVFRTVTRRTERSKVCVSSNNAPNDLPIVVLTNPSTVSAAEYMVGGLQDLDRALVVGETTFGKGLIQGVFDLEGKTLLQLTVSRFETGIGRRTQRDYANEDRYTYYFQDRSSEAVTPPPGPSFRTPTGRVKYGFGGITPDAPVNPLVFPSVNANLLARLYDSAFAFAMALRSGKIKQFETMAVSASVDYGHVVKGNEFLISDELFQAYKQFAVDNHGLPASEADRFSKQMNRAIRNELVEAAYGTQAALRIAREYDPQIQKAIELLPQAKELWERSKIALAARARRPSASP